MNQKERLEMIRRKRLREQRRRKFLIRRVFVFAVAIIIAALVIFAIKGCVSSVSQRAEQKRQEELAAMSMQTPTTAPAQKSNSSDIDQNYYQNSIVEVDRVYIASFIMVAIMCMLPVLVRDTHFLS